MQNMREPFGQQFDCSNYQVTKDSLRQKYKYKFNFTHNVNVVYCLRCVILPPCYTFTLV